MDIERFIKKIREFIPINEVIQVLEKLPDDLTLKQVSKDAPFIGGSINIALYIIEKVYEAKIPVQNRLSITLMRIMLESVSNVKVEEVLDFIIASKIKGGIMKVITRLGLILN